jgi:hypothetical protein
MASKQTTTDESAPEGVTTLEETKKVIGDPTPEDLGKPATLTGPGGTKVTVPERAAATLKGMGYK